MRLALLILLILVAGAAAFCFRRSQTETYRDSKVTAGEITRPINALAVHLSNPKYLTIAGKTYTGVRGLPPYYLDVPELNAILFVTGEKNHKVVFHLVNLESKQDIQIGPVSSGFGSSIGFGGKPGEQGTDYIESVQSNRVTIAMRSLDWKETMVLNLATKSIELHETLSFDATGQVTNRSVQTNITPAKR